MRPCKFVKGVAEHRETLLWKSDNPPRRWEEEAGIAALYSGNLPCPKLFVRI